MNQTKTYSQEQMLKDINRIAFAHNTLPEVPDGASLIYDLNDSSSQIEIHPYKKLTSEIQQLENTLEDLKQQLIDLDNQVNQNGNQDQKLSLQLKDLQKRLNNQNKGEISSIDINDYKSKLNDLNEQLKNYTKIKVKNEYNEILNNVQQRERQKLIEQQKQIEGDLEIIQQADYKKYLNHKINCLQDIDNEGQEFEQQIQEYTEINQQLKDKTIYLESDLLYKQNELKEKSKKYYYLKQKYEEQDNLFERRRQRLDKLIQKNQEIIENSSQIYSPQENKNQKYNKQLFIGLMISVIIYILYNKL